MKAAAVVATERSDTMQLKTKERCSVQGALVRGGLALEKAKVFVAVVVAVAVAVVR